MARARSAPILLLVLILTAIGCGPKPGASATIASTGLTIDQVWARPSTTMAGMPGMQSGTSAAYLIIRNGATADRLTAAKRDIAKATEIHQTTMEGGMARMLPVGAVDVPANATVEFKPGGYHLMLVEPVRELRAGDSFSLVLVFEKAGQVMVPVAVRPNT